MWFNRKKGPEPKGPVTIEESSSTIKRLLNSLSGAKGRENFERLNYFLEGLDGIKDLPVMLDPVKLFQKDQLIKELVDSQIFVTDWARNFINQSNFEILPRDQGLLIDYVSPQDLGIEKRIPLDQFFKLAHEKGLKNLPVDAVLYLIQNPAMTLPNIFFSGSLPCEQDKEKRDHIFRLSFYKSKVKDRPLGKNLELVRIANDRYIEPNTLVVFES